MSLGQGSGGRREDGVPPTNMRLLVAAGLILLIPVVALLWVGSYARAKPELFGFPFFFWYQLMWVFLTAAISWVTYLLVHRARSGGPGGGPGSSGGAHRGEHP
ncbi:MAG: DUF3311 domain-containing protein [Actinomycetota bacterium]|nr:DUF3311 domain-containing protein [Actinomycetota bacterium]